MEHSPNTIRDGVLRAIAEHKVAMRPAAFFTVEFILIALVSLLVLVLTVGLAGFIFFALRVNGHDSLLAFGPHGVLTFLFVFPWVLFLIDIALLLVLQTLIRRYAFGYKKPIFVVLGVLFVAGGASAFILDRETSLHDQLLERSHRGGLPPPFGDAYGRARGPAPHEQGIYRGVVSDIHESGFMMTHDDLDDEQNEQALQVLLPKGQSSSAFSVGDHVYVYGTELNRVITAIGIQKLPSPTR